MKIDGVIYDADAIREMESQAECAAAEITRLRAALDAMTAERDAALDVVARLSDSETGETDRRLALKDAAAIRAMKEPKG